MLSNETNIKPLTGNGMGDDGYQLGATTTQDPNAFTLTGLNSTTSATTTPTTNGMGDDGYQIGAQPSTLQNVGTTTPTTTTQSTNTTPTMQALYDQGMPTTQSDPNYGAWWQSQPLESQIQGAMNGTWGGDSLSQFFNLRLDTTLPDAMRQQIAQAYAHRTEMPYSDPTQSTYVPPTSGMGPDGGPVPGGTTTDNSYTGVIGGNEPGAPLPNPYPDAQTPGTGTQTPGTTTPTTQTPGQVASEADLLAFRDQGDGVYRGWKNPSPTAAENTIGEDGRVQSNYSDMRGNEFRAESETAAGMSAMEVERAQAAFAAENGRSMTQEELSAWQMNQILSQDSPLMSLARQDGVDMANRVGLRNSSLAAGSSMREMARAATPLAMQDAQAHGQMQSQNQALESQRLEQNAGRQQQSNLFNADAENAATSQEFASEAQRRQFNAGLTTQTNLTNAGMANDMLNADRQRTYGMNLQQLAGDQDFAKQQTANQTAVDLANIEGQYKAFISENDTAARMFDSAYNVMAQIMSNNEIDGNQASEQIDYVMNYLNNQMELLLGFSLLSGGGPEAPGADFDFSGFDGVGF